MTYILTGLLIALAILSLGDSFSNPQIFLLIAAAGLGISWWQTEYNRRPIILKIAVNAAILAIAVTALLPFLNSEEGQLLKILIKAWVYVIVAFTFILYEKKDFYLIQVLSLGLIMLACSWPSISARMTLAIIIGFLAIWTMILRKINLASEKNSKLATSKSNLKPSADFAFSIILAAIIIATTVPIYLAIPRIRTSSPVFIPRNQNYSQNYADYPKDNIISFLSSSLDQLATGINESEKNSDFTKEQPREKLLDPRDKDDKTDFWHSEKPTETEEKTLQGEPEPSPQDQEPDQDKDTGQPQEERLTQPPQERELSEKEASQPREEQPEPESKSRLSIFEIIIYALIWGLVMLVLAAIAAKLSPYLLDKARIKQALRNNDYRLAIILAYKLLCRCLSLFGLRYPVVIDPKLQAKLASNKLKSSASDFEFLTKLFVEARYSLHDTDIGQKQNAFDYYANVIEDLKQNGEGLGRYVLKMDFLFRL